MFTIPAEVQSSHSGISFRISMFDVALHCAKFVNVSSEATVGTFRLPNYLRKVTSAKNELIAEIKTELDVVAAKSRRTGRMERRFTAMLEHAGPRPPEVPGAVDPRTTAGTGEARSPLRALCR